MASIHKEVLVNTAADLAWAAMRDVGAVHTRLATGFVTDCKLDGDARVVSFANGMRARERIIDIDDGARRLVWSVVGGRLTHHNAAAQVFAEGAGHCRIAWIADLLPNELAPVIQAMIGQGLVAMKRTLEAAPP